MSTNAESNIGESTNPLLDKDRIVITFIQLIFLYTSLIFMVFIRLFTTERILYEADNGIQQLFLDTLVLKPLAVFLATVLLIKVIKLLFGRKIMEIGFRKIRTVLFVISVIVIVLFAGCVLYFFVVLGSKYSLFYFYYDLIKIDSSKNIIAAVILYITKNCGIIIAAITGVLFSAKSYRKKSLPV